MLRAVVQPTEPTVGPTFYPERSRGGPSSMSTMPESIQQTFAYYYQTPETPAPNPERRHASPKSRRESCENPSSTPNLALHSTDAPPAPAIFHKHVRSSRRRPSRTCNSHDHDRFHDSRSLSPSARIRSSSQTQYFPSGRPCRNETPPAPAPSLSTSSTAALARRLHSRDCPSRRNPQTKPPRQCSP